MTTIILTYRNRDTDIVKNCLESLSEQTEQSFKVCLVNYGSNSQFTKAIDSLSVAYDFVHTIHCKTEGELWCKARAINIALKQCDTPNVFVGDVDMIFHPEFVNRLNSISKEKGAAYFQVGFLSENESKKVKRFKDYQISFKSNNEATGMTLFNTKDLLEINGYDEFYHGWGSEDTDVHIRLRNNGKSIYFYEDEILILHQWHPKTYRSKNSLEPFHSHLEQINQYYLECSRESKKTKANVNFKFGYYLDSEYESLENPDVLFSISNRRDRIKGFIKNVLQIENSKVVRLSISTDSEYRSLKQFLKKLTGKKIVSFLSLQQTNDLLLEYIVSHLRNCPYKYKYDRQNQNITLTIKLQRS